MARSKSAGFSSLRPVRNEKLRLFQKEGKTFATIDEKNFMAVPDVLLAAVALANGAHTIDEIAYHLVKNTSMPKEEMAARLHSAFDILSKNEFISLKKGASGTAKKKKKAKK